MNRISLVLASALLLFGNVVMTVGQMPATTSPRRAAQAKSEEEFDFYLEIVTAQGPQDVARLVNDFALNFQTSELLASAYEYEVHAFEQLNDVDRMLDAGTKALAKDPDNLDVLLSLASAMANRAGQKANRAELLSRAEMYANRVLEVVDRTRIPQNVTLEQWHAQKHRMQSDAHQVLGVVAFQRGQLSKAIADLNTAISLAPTPQGVQFLALGLALSAAQKKTEAEQKFRQAAALGPDVVQRLAMEQLDNLTKHENRR